MNHQEKKYRIESFDDIRKKLLEVSATKVRDVSSVHYYGVNEGNDVEKFVVYPDRTEIHMLRESDGKYELIEHRTIPGKEEGFLWLKNRGYKTANMVNMEYEEYGYGGGIVGLYTIDDFLHSVILDFPPDEHEKLEQEFGLQSAEVIAAPYNKYLGTLGKLHSIILSGDGGQI